ncbi:MAG: hypothetical protein ACJAUP_003613 [Cellvibrionaceae bacterium]|jgi:hypothetical protein
MSDYLAAVQYHDSGAAVADKNCKASRYCFTQ